MFLRPNFTGTSATTSPRLSAWTRSTPVGGASKAGLAVGVAVFAGVFGAAGLVWVLVVPVAAGFFVAGGFDFFVAALAVGFGAGACVTAAAFVSAPAVISEVTPVVSSPGKAGGATVSAVASCG